MAVFSVFQIISVVTLSVFLVGFLNIILSNRENACEMTYMYEYPQFVRIKVSENNLYPQYGLYAYSEGRFTEKARKMRFDGIPVLFLPGNAGSHKQVRSLASVALRKALPLSKYGFHFDYFTIDFNDELSGLFGGVLEKQTLFSSHCLNAIFNLYQSNKSNIPKPNSIIIIGHSMGGTIARNLLTYSENKEKIDLIITLATPHEFPVITIDHYFKKIYDRINGFWELKNINTSNLPAITNFWKKKVFITIGSGERDLLVPSALTSSPYSDISSLVTSIPAVWLTTDHLCIVWCKQLILVLNRFLFSIIDTNLKQLTSNTSQIVHMGKHYLKAGYTKNQTIYNMPVEFVPDANWYEDIRRQYSFKHEKVTKTWYYMVRLIDLPDNEAVTLQGIDLEDNEWLFGCQARYVHGQYRICKNGRHLSQYSRWIASLNGKRKIATLDMQALRSSYPHWTHLLLRISPTNRPVEIHVDIHSKGSRRTQGSLPALYNLANRVIIKETAKNALQYNISIPGLDMLYQAFLLYVTPLECSMMKSHHASAELIIPWADGHETYDFFTESQKAPMKIKLLKGNPNLSKNSTLYASIILTLDPQCKYSISISVSPYDVLGQLARHYSTYLPAYLAAILLLVLRHWAVEMYSKENPSISFHAALCSEYTKPYYILLSARLASMVVILIPMLNRMSSIFMVGGGGSQNFILLPLFLYIVALGSAHVLGVICWGFLIFSGQIAHRIVLRLISFGKRGGGNRFWEWVTKEIRNAPGFGGFILIALSCGSCGAVALFTGAVFYFFLLTKMYEDYLEDFFYKALAKVAKKIGKISIRKPSKVNKDKETVNNTENKNEQNVENDGSTNESKLNAEKISNTTKDNQESLLDDTVNGLNNEETVENVSETNSPETSQSNTDANIRRQSSKDSDTEFDLNSLHFHFSMFFIWSFITLLNVPTLLTWAHNFKYNKILDQDPSFYPSLIMSISAFSLWQIDAPKFKIKYYDILEKIIYVAGVIAIIITPMSLYCLNYLLAIIFLIITLHQTFPVKSDQNVDDSMTENVTAEISSTDEQENNFNNTNTQNNTENENSNTENQSEQSTARLIEGIENDSNFQRFEKLKLKLESE